MAKKAMDIVKNIFNKPSAEELKLFNNAFKDGDSFTYAYMQMHLYVYTYVFNALTHFKVPTGCSRNPNGSSKAGKCNGAMNCATAQPPKP